MVYAGDKESEDIIRRALAGLGVDDAVFRRGGVQAAMTEAAKQPALKLLVVGVDDRVDLDAISKLISVCAPSTGVVVIGNPNDLSLYRHLREAGVAEYIFKPLVDSLVIKACQRALTGVAPREGSPLGEVVLFLGVRGGSGATTLAVRTAWELARSPRPVLLLDLQLKFGDVALQLDQTPNDALRVALQSVERVDELFIERGVIRVADRLDLMASLEPLNEPLQFSEDAVLALLEPLKRRYRYVVVDVPRASAALMPRVLQLPGAVVLVSDGRLVSARDVRRLREFLGRDGPDRSVMHILNRQGMPGDLPMQDFVRAAGCAPDIVVPYEREIAATCNMGVQAKPDCPELRRGLAPLLRRIAGLPIEDERPLLARLFA
jgi:pilus assembly protein CpaE